ncbi:MAG: glycosyltransferase [Desulfatirhabdiaceae bacterium]
MPFLASNAVLVIAYKYWTQDPRILREIAALVRFGYAVDFICIRTPNGPPPTLEGVNIVSFPMQKKRGSTLQYVTEYLVFSLLLFFNISALFLKKKHKVIIPFVMPEFLVLLCIVPKLLGAKIIMDWEDPSIEVFRAKFHNTKKYLYPPLLLFEKAASFLADVIITPNEGFRRAFVNRRHPGEKIHIVMNAPDMSIFNMPAESLASAGPDKKFIILYSGSILKRHGLDVLIRALPIIAKEIPEATLQILGNGEEDFFSKCRNLWKELGMAGHIQHLPGVFITDMPKVILNSSIGVVPNRKDAFTSINFPQRIFEFGILKRPIVVSRLPGIQDYYDEESLCFFEPENHVDLAEKIISLYRSPEKRSALIEKNYDITAGIDWENAFLNIVGKLSGKQ